MENALSQFKFAQFQFTLKPLETIHLPTYKGSTLRGAFGYAFKRIACVTREKDCNSCLLKGKCVYSYVFETPPPPDTTKMRKYPYAPHPFVIIPPLEEKSSYREDETLCFDLTLIGRSIDYLPYFIYTFEELGGIGIGKGKGKYQLEEVRCRGKTKKWEAIYSSKDKILQKSCGEITLKDLENNLHSSIGNLRLVFLTPTRLKFDGNLSPNPEFHILLRNLLRRISLLSYFHCGEELNIDFKGLIEQAKGVQIKRDNLSWFDWERYSNRQETKMKMGGFVGAITFAGEFENFLPFLLLGEYIHVGKGTSFGLGKYEILRD